MAEHSLHRCPRRKSDHRRQALPRYEAPTDVIAGLFRAERAEIATQRDPLLELPQLMGIEFLIEFRLARKHDLQQFLLRSLQVESKGVSLPGFRRQVMRFVHHQHRRQSPSCLCNRKLFNTWINSSFALPAAGKPKSPRM